MSAKTKILVFKMREVIYTAVFAVLGICLVILLIFMFIKGQSGKNLESLSHSIVDEKPVYIAGVYQSSVVLRNQVISVEVVVDKNNINSVRLIQTDDAITTMFPLFAPTMNELATQIVDSQSVENITYSEENKYTAMVLLEAVKNALKKAEIS